MFAVGRMIHEQVKQRAGSLPFSPMQMQCLLCVWKERPAMRDAAKHLGITPPSATVLVRGLMKLGLIRHKRDATDRRSWRLEMTPKGIRLIQQRLDLVTEGLGQVAGALTNEEKNELSRLLSKIAASRQK